MMLNLAAPTDPSWLPRALEHLDVVLLDHAHCEKKAASTAMNILFRYQKQDWLMRPLSEHAREELEHFELMLDVLNKRGIAFEPLAPSPYAKRLRGQCRGAEPHRLVDTLLCCALIEARSCERMKMLSEHAPDAELRELYGSLLASEARHHTTFVDLAARVLPRAEVMERLAQLAQHEANVVNDPQGETRLHN